MSEQLLYTMEEAAAKLRCGRSRMFQLAASGEVETVSIGRSRRVPLEALEDYVARLRAGSSAA